MQATATTCRHGTMGYVLGTHSLTEDAQESVLQDALVEKVASVNNNTIVIVNSVGPIIMDAWIENPNGQ